MKLHIYINNAEAFLEGDYNFSMTVYADKNMIERNKWDNLIFLKTVNVNLNIDLDLDQIRKTAADQLDNAIKEVRAEMQTQVEALETRKQNLLSIEHQPLDRIGK